MQYYYLVLAFHLISILIWISALTYLSRLMIIHTQALGNQNIQLCESIKKEENFIFNTLIHSGFYFAITFGVILIYLNNAILASGVWFYVKLFFISLLIIVHHLCKIYMNQLNKNEFIKKDSFLTWFSFLPLIIGSLIVLVTLTKPL